MKQFFAKFLYILADCQGQLILIFLAILFTSILETVGIGLVGPFMSLVTNPDAVNNSYWLQQFYQLLGLNSRNVFVAVLGLIIISIFYLKSALRFYLQRYIFRFGYNQQGKLRLKLLQAYLEAPYTFHLKRNTALLIQNIVNETQQFCNRILLASLNTAVHVLVLLTLLALLIIIDAFATAVVLGVLLITLGIYHFFKQKLALWGKDMSESQTNMIRIINHSLGGLKESRIIGSDGYFLGQMETEAYRYSEAVSSLFSFRILPRLVIEPFIITFLLGFTSFFLLSGRDIEHITSVLSVFAMAAIRIMPSVTGVATGLSAMRTGAFAFNQLYYDLKDLEALEPEQKAIIGNTNKLEATAIKFEKQLRVEGITYSYPESETTALKSISFPVNKGQSIALIGKSGAGKTTLVDVILGLLIPEGGDIKVDNQSIYKDLKSWQKLVGYIPQSIFLIDDTIERNIAFGVPDELIDHQKLFEAIAAAQLEELIAELPAGIETSVGEKGVRLSGGQRQRIGIARALYHCREILVLDEATSALDSDTENLITEAIRSLSGQKTIIVIAHRLSTVEYCDQVYLLDKGQIVRSGTYQEVVLEKSYSPAGNQKIIK